MNRINLEKIKSYVMAILVVASLIQVGILWRYQNHKFPTSFLTSIFTNINGTGVSGDEKIKDELFVPSRVIITEGEDEPHWVIGEENNNYKELLQDAKNYLRDILQAGHTQQKPEILPISKWEELVLNGPFIFEFSTNIDLDLLKLFFNANNVSANAPAGVYKMIVSPWEDVNKYNTIYITDKVKIYKYIIPFNPKGVSCEKYNDILNDIIISLYEKGSICYRTYNQLDPDNKSPYSISPDVLVITKGPKLKVFNSIISSIPEELVVENDTSISEPDRIARIILGDEKDEYDYPEIDGEGTITIKSQDNIYRLYKNGLLEYKYLPDTQDILIGDVDEAFQRALRFLSSKRYIIAETRFYLSGIRENKDKKSYEFTFDYKVNEFPIFFNNYETSGREKKVLNNAIVINANGTRVLSCWWFMRSIAKGGEIEQLNVGFDDLMDDISNTYDELKNNPSMTIDDIHMSYKAGDGMGKQALKPIWVLKVINEKLETKYYIIKIRNE